MNTLAFIVCGFSLLSFLKSTEDKQTPLSILRESVFIFWGMCLFSGLGLALRTFSTLNVLEIELLLTVIFFILFLILNCGIHLFLTVAGLGFWILEFAPSWTWAAFFVLAACFLYAAFRFALWSFQNRSLFYKPAAPFAGHPLLMVQSFWSALIITVFLLLFV